jgi:hypothetical protein
LKVLRDHHVHDAPFGALLFEGWGPLRAAHPIMIDIIFFF